MSSWPAPVAAVMPEIKRDVSVHQGPKQPPKKSRTK